MHDLIFPNKNLSNNEKKKIAFNFVGERFKLNQRTVNSIDTQAIIDAIKVYLERRFFFFF